uniref:MADF domain-containing protein n=1 Tax=Bactrocera dorsalis TaxID=27457 RepID=A0A034W2U7_BACDO
MNQNSGQRNHNREENKILANLVEQLPQLYDKDHDLYGKPNALDQAWKIISLLWDKPVPECKGRWRNMRAAYARSIDAYKTKRGPNRSRPYYLEENMRYLNPHLLNEIAAIATVKDEAILTDGNATEAAQSNGQNNEQNNSETIANENDVHDMHNTHTFETFSLVMPLIEQMDEQSLRDLQLIIERKLKQTIAIKNDNDNELSAPMQQLPIQAIKQELEL